jgi:fatty-acid desaturase
MQLGLLDLPWWGYVLVTLGLTHVTIASVTIFLHRYQAHRALALHPIAGHFFRFWLWLTTGMVTRERAAIHRKHHATTDTAEHPHSLTALWSRSNASKEQLVKQLEDWCRCAEESGIGALREFSRTLRCYGSPLGDRK